MKTISTYKIYEYLKEKFPDDETFLKNGTIDRNSEKSIGVFLAPSTRATQNIAIGGVDCTTVRMLPVNILVHWTSNQKVCDDKAIEIFDTLLTEKNNFTVSDVKIALIDLLDNSPVYTGRDDKNICEETIRTNVYYYV